MQISERLFQLQHCLVNIAVQPGAEGRLCLDNFVAEALISKLGEIADEVTILENKPIPPFLRGDLPQEVTCLEAYRRARRFQQRCQTGGGDGAA